MILPWRGLLRAYAFLCLNGDSVSTRNHYTYLTCSPVQAYSYTGGVTMYNRTSRFYKLSFNCPVVLFLIVLLLTISLRPVFASDKLSLVTGEWKPYTSSTMDAHGFFSEIVTATFQKAGIEVRIDFYPWKRCEANVKSGGAFAAFPYSITEERKKFAYFSDPVSISKTVFFYSNRLHNTSVCSDTSADLKRYRIVGVLGYFYKEKFEEEMLKVAYVAKEEKALQLILYERYDLLPLNNYVGFSLIQEKFPDKGPYFSVCKQPLSIDTLHLMISKRYPNSKVLLEKFNSALIDLKAEGTYQKIESKHFPMIVTQE